MGVLRWLGAWLLVGLALCGLSLACGPVAAPPTAAPTVDAFAVVRATSQAAYASGQAALGRGDYLQACVLLDTARTNDPENRPEIQQALDQALQRCLTPSSDATAAPPVVQQRTIVVATLPRAAGAATSAAGGGGTTAVAQGGTSTTPSAVGAGTPFVMGGGTPLAAGGGTPSAAGGGTPAATGGGTPALAGAGSPTAVAGGAPAVATPAAAAPSLVGWNDPQGRFSIAAPTDWTKIDQPQALFGNGVVQFRDPSGRAEVDVAVDTSTRAVSPELYAASMELAMQQQVPGYASEQVQPGSVAGNPSIRRVFTFTQRDASGQDHQARGFQVTVVKGSTPYIISGSAPADQFQPYGPTFDRIVESFRFS